MNRITNLLVLLIVTSFILSTTAIMYASGFTENNAAPPSGFTESNNTGNAYCDSCNNDIYSGSMDFANMVLAAHNRERAAVGVPPLVWSDQLAADAKPYAEHLLTTAELEHPSQE